MKKAVLLVLIALSVWISACSDLDVLSPGVKVVSVSTNQYGVAFSGSVTLDSINNEINVYPSDTSNTVIIASNYVYAAGITTGHDYLSNHTLSIQTFTNGNLSVSLNSNLTPDGWNIHSIGSVISCYLPTNASLIISNVKITLFNGMISVNNVTVSNLDVSCINGNIKVSNVSAAKITENIVNGVLENTIGSVKQLDAMATNGACFYTMDSFQEVSNCSVKLKMLNGSCDIKLGASAQSNLLLGVTLLSGFVNNSLPFQNNIASNLNAFVGGNGNQLNSLSVTLLNGAVNISNK